VAHLVSRKLSPRRRFGTMDTGIPGMTDRPSLAPGQARARICNPGPQAGGAPEGAAIRLQPTVRETPSPFLGRWGDWSVCRPAGVRERSQGRGERRILDPDLGRTDVNPLTAQPIDAEDRILHEHQAMDPGIGSPGRG
jgi:hypothetical protein